jgi:hypothetical protein
MRRKLCRTNTTSLTRTIHKILTVKAARGHWNTNSRSQRGRLLLMRWDYVSQLQPLTGLLFVHQVTYMSMESCGWIILTGKNWRTLRKTCPDAILFTTDPTWSDPGNSLGVRTVSWESPKQYITEKDGKTFLFYYYSALLHFQLEAFRLLSRQYFHILFICQNIYQHSW